MEVVISLFSLLFIISIFFMIIRSQISSKNQAQKASQDMDELLSKMQRDVISVTGTTIPGKDIKNVIGMVRGVSDTQATRKEEFELAEKEALFKMLFEAKNLGANAVVEIKLSIGTYEQQGSRWQVSQVVYYGTAVQI